MAQLYERCLSSNEWPWLNWNIGHQDNSSSILEILTSRMIYSNFAGLTMGRFCITIDNKTIRHSMWRGPPSKPGFLGVYVVCQGHPRPHSTVMDNIVVYGYCIICRWRPRNKQSIFFWTHCYVCGRRWTRPCKGRNSLNVKIYLHFVTKEGMCFWKHETIICVFYHFLTLKGTVKSLI